MKQAFFFAVLCAVSSVPALGLPQALALSPMGSLTQFAGTEGCLSDSGSTGDPNCARGHALPGPASVAVSPGGKNIYAVAYNGAGGVVALTRDLATGKLTQLAGTDGCMSAAGPVEGCAQNDALSEAGAMTVSPDDSHVYVVSGGDQGLIAVLKRDSATGVLSSTGLDTSILENLTSVAVSPDGKNVYVTSGTASAIAVFRRNSNGSLTQLAGSSGCIAEDNTQLPSCADGRALSNPTSVAVSSDGKSVYIASSSSNAVAVFQRDGTDGSLTQLAGSSGCIAEDNTQLPSCADGRALSNPTSVAVSSDGKSVYSTSFNSHAVAVFTRDPGGGVLTQATEKNGCVSETTREESCVLGNGLGGATSVTVSPDGNSVYVASYDSNSVAAFQRNSNGSLTQLAGLDNCISEGGSAGCGSGRGLLYPVSVAVSPDGANTYVGSRSALSIFSRFGAEQGSTPPSTLTPAASSTPPTTPSAAPAESAAASTRSTRAQILGRFSRLDCGFVNIRLRCSAAEGDRCKGMLVLKSATSIKARGGRTRRVTLGKSPFSIAGDKTATVKLRLSKVNQRLIARLKTVRVKAIAGTDTPTGNKTTSKLFTLRAAQKSASGN